LFILNPDEVAVYSESVCSAIIAACFTLSHVTSALSPSAFPVTPRWQNEQTNANLYFARMFLTVHNMSLANEVTEFLVNFALADIPKWKKDYFVACNKVILAETLSPTFVGMQFSQVAEICYTQLNLLLLAIEARKYEGGEIAINPRKKIINPNAIGKGKLT
jgi:hypothetical protein